MFKLIEFLKKRPSDMTIRILRAVLSLLIASLLVYTNRNFTLPFQGYYANFAEWVAYGLALIFIVHAVIFGVLGMCVFQRKTMKKVQMVTGLALILLGSLIGYELPTNTITNATTEYQLNSIPQAPSTPIHTGRWLIIYGVFSLVAGISGKMITQSCIKHKEVITKIRV